MSILIKGMEMPTSCDKCPFLDYEEGFCFASGVNHESGWYESTLCPGGIKDGRHEDCPLIPVPKHGRLIDGDALAAKCDSPYWCVWLSDIDNAPTIIPEDPEEEEMK